MNMETLKNLAQLGPALGSVAVIGILCWKLLSIFEVFLDKFRQSVDSNREAMHSVSKGLDALSENVKKNSEVTERMSVIIDNKYDYVPRKSPAH